MLTKYQLFGIFNLLISFLLTFVLTKILIQPVPVEGQQFEFDLALLLFYLPKLIVVFSLVTNLLIAYKLIFRNDAKNFKIYGIWTLATIIWLPLMFIGYFFASDFSFIAISLSLTALAFYFIQKISKKSAFYISGITILVIIFTILGAFEENYCWLKGSEAEAKLIPGEQNLTQLTKEELEMLSDYGYKEGDLLAVGWKAHILCHKNFKFIDALKEKYLFSK